MFNSKLVLEPVRRMLGPRSVRKFSQLSRFVLLGSFAGSALLRADIAWKGTLPGEKARFALTDTATGASKWVSVGGSFESYTISQYDEQKQILVLLKDGARLELGLASSQYTPPAVPDSSLQDLRAMSGFRLAQALADRGDAQLQSLLAQHRDAVLNRQDVARRLAAGERLIHAGTPDAPSPVAMKSYRADAARWDQEIARMDIEIRTVADAHRKDLIGGP